MYEYLVQNPIIAIIFMLIVVVTLVFLIIKKMKSMGLEKIRSYVYHSFIEAEHKFNQGENEQKFEYVVQLARSHIPMPFKLVITQKSLRKVIQLWFDLCKDLLDDGKLNGSHTQKEE